MPKSRVRAVVGRRVFAVHAQSAMGRSSRLLKRQSLKPNSLPTQQDQNTRCNGEDRQDHAETANTQKLNDAPGDEKDG